MRHWMRELALGRLSLRSPVPPSEKDGHRLVTHRAGVAAAPHPARINDTAIKRTKLNRFISASILGCKVISLQTNLLEKVPGHPHP